ncbi:uncharacterized protein LOC124795720 isoform X2 [Schistocerca piceifrons]|uniref:uncharacterized protein LOC124795720 isoform X2 n=1 Tax=Schistocerca piceifrons TaxID=274613 RepID=UPI001F5F234E|nr:uncharacterized protein LOC124795720 isoform X2 [Schistocerca piceifrons]
MASAAVTCLSLAVLLGIWTLPSASPLPAPPSQTAGASCQPCSGAGSPVCGRDSELNTTSAFLTYCHLKRFNCINRTNFQFTMKEDCIALSSAPSTKKPTNVNRIPDQR